MLASQGKCGTIARKIELPQGMDMAIMPVVRYMRLCDDWRLDPQNNRRVTIIGLISDIRALEDSPYPLFYKEMWSSPKDVDKRTAKSSAHSRKPGRKCSRHLGDRSPSASIRWRLLAFRSGFGTARFPKPAFTPCNSGTRVNCSSSAP